MIAFFPGKFQPPHLGHILTIMSFYELFDEIIIGITNDGPNVCSRKKAKHIFELAFRFLPKVKVVLINGVLIKRKSIKGLPSFDLLLSGNSAVIDWARAHYISYLVVARSDGIGFSGSDIRSIKDGQHKNSI